MSDASPRDRSPQGRSPVRAASPDGPGADKGRDRSVSRSPVRRDRSRSRSRERRRSRSPVRRRSRTPPRRRSRSPARRSRSPPRRSRSRSPRRRSYSPRRRSPSRSRTPPRRNRSRSRSRSPVPAYARVPPRYGLQMFVAGFNFLSTERDVERRFGKYGNVTEVRIVRDPGGKSRGFGFVAMDSEEDVRNCIREMNGRDWEGRRLQVELCRNPK